jgi:ABC-type tungstate transport system substrate-binding protein
MLDYLGNLWSNHPDISLGISVLVLVVGCVLVVLKRDQANTYPFWIGIVFIILSLPIVLISMLIYLLVLAFGLSGGSFGP